MTTGALVLGAGYSRRFGSDKRTHTLPSGETMIEATLRRYGAVFTRVLVVLHPGDEPLARSLESSLAGVALTTVIAADADRGMGHSLAAGARAASGSSHLFVALADMPFVREETLQTLRRTIARSGDGTILVPTFDGVTGHPVGFGKRFLPELERLRGDVGARPLLQRNPHAVQRLPVDDPGVLRDVDTPDDLSA